MIHPDYTLYLITDRGILGGRDLCAALATAIDGGVSMVQLREKHGTSREFYDLGRRVHALTTARGVPLIINDRVDLMLALDAEGVHVGPKDIPVAEVRRLAPGKIVGASVNSIEDLRAAEEGGADYVGIGPVFPTTSKSDLRQLLGPAGLRDIVSKARIPCVAIGGIACGNAAQLRGTGIAGLAVISAVLGAEDVGAAAQRMRKAFVSTTGTQGDTPC